ncbi:type III PLP-dependent enzyme [Psychrobacter sp. ENNN9_III]|uniref:type III PLP-dependent enzyme n=1 Tax=Psychrobacter sp. ENNN9_III TaxID=1254334 RepID=UPI00071E766B|nr:type III PLP-dependent enzyme [Psychrobacter sp. ENNN9_III]
MTTDMTTSHSAQPADNHPLPAKIINTIHEHSTQSTPLCAYIYDLDALAERIKTMKHCLPANTQLFYAIKANAEPEILSTLVEHVDGFEAASAGELNWLQTHQPNHPIIFGGPGKLTSDLQQAIQQQIDTIHVESLVELTRIQTLSQSLQLPVRIFLRMNIDIGDIGSSKLVMGGKPTPFGLDETHLKQALSIIDSSPFIEFRGFHFHLMSHQLSVERHLLLMQRYIEMVKKWQQDYPSLPSQLTINVGGGIGIHYDPQPQHFEWQVFCQQLASILTKNPQFMVRFEIGRFITAPCGYYVMEVLDIKKNLGETFVIGHGGTHHFRTPAAQQHNHPFYIVPRRVSHAIKAEPQENLITQAAITGTKATLVGQLCTPKDILAKGQWIDALHIGDYLVFTLAGAYAWNISHQNFLMHEPPKMIFL